MDPDAHHLLGTDDRPTSAGTVTPSGMVIDCSSCRFRHTPVCDDCLVTFILDRSAVGPVSLPVEEAETIRALQEGGLVPGVRHAPLDVVRESA